MKPSLRTRQIVIAIAAAGIGAGSALALQPRGAAPAATPPAVVSAAPMTLPDIASLVEQSSPAVVQITVTGKSDEGDAIADFGDEGPFGDFLKRFPFPRQMPDPDSRPSLGMGSGFILTPDGYIVTNQHVVGQADKVTVKLSDKREFDARIVGGDRHTDIALLKIDAANLPTVTLGNSDGVRVGQWVVAIGAPFGFDHSATQGIVSALSRSLPGDQYVPFIQTDVAVNPGNSGGPLFDLSGRVVGINSQIYSRTGGYMGLSFAIPINTAMSVVEQIRTSGRVERGWLGLVMQPVTRDLASSFGAEQPKGALISQVNEGGPAAEAGVKAGDIITAYDGKPVAESSDLPPLVGATKPGRKVPLTVWRGGRERTLEVKVGSLPDSGNTRVGQASPDGRGARLNVTVSDLTQEQRRQLGIEGGVLVNGVGNGAAKAAGMRPGDVILQVNGRDVKDVAQFRDLVKDLPADRKVPMLVKRGEGAVFLAISLPPARG